METFYSRRMCRFVRWLSSDSGLKNTAVSSMCRRGLPHQQTVKESSVHFTGTLTTVLLLACSFLPNVPPPAPPPPGGSSSGLLGPDERTATRARKCTACLLSPCSCSTSFTATPVGKNVFPRKRRPVCLNQGGKVENFFFFFPPLQTWVHSSHWLHWLPMLWQIVLNGSRLESIGWVCITRRAVTENQSRQLRVLFSHPPTSSFGTRPHFIFRPLRSCHLPR